MGFDIDPFHQLNRMLRGFWAMGILVSRLVETASKIILIGWAGRRELSALKFAKEKVKIQKINWILERFSFKDCLAFGTQVKGKCERRKSVGGKDQLEKNKNKNSYYRRKGRRAAEQKSKGQSNVACLLMEHGCWLVLWQLSQQWLGAEDWDESGQRPRIIASEYRTG